MQSNVEASSEDCKEDSVHNRTERNRGGEEIIELPNFLAPRPKFESGTSIVGLSTESMSTITNKFALFGNMSSFFNQMVNVDRLRPDIKTFSLLLHCIQPTLEEESYLVCLLREHKVKPDVDFFNQLMRNRASRCAYEDARSVLEQMGEFDLAPDIATYGCLAVACTNDRMSKKLLQDMHASRLRPNVQIITSLIRNAAYRFSLSEVLRLLHQMSINQIQPDIKTLKTLERFYHKYQDLHVRIEKYGYSENAFKYKKLRLNAGAVYEDLRHGSPAWKNYIKNYKIWLQKTEVECPSHPWKQFLTSRDIELVETGTVKQRKQVQNILHGGESL